MGSAAQQLLKFLPGAGMTAAGALTGNAPLATAGATNLAGSMGDLSTGAVSPDQQIANALATTSGTAGISPGMVMGLGPGSPPLPPQQQGLGSWGNMAAQVGVPALGIGGALMANRPQPQPLPAPASPAPAPQPVTPTPPVGTARISLPFQTLANYRNFLASG